MNKIVMSLLAAVLAVGTALADDDGRHSGMMGQGSMAMAGGPGMGGGNYGTMPMAGGGYGMMGGMMPMMGQGMMGCGCSCNCCGGRSMMPMMGGYGMTGGMMPMMGQGMMNRGGMMMGGGMGYGAGAYEAIPEKEARKRFQAYVDQVLKGGKITAVERQRMPMGATTYWATVKDSHGNDFEIHMNPWGRIMGPFCK